MESVLTSVPILFGHDPANFEIELHIMIPSQFKAAGSNATPQFRSVMYMKLDNMYDFISAYQPVDVVP